MKEDNKFEEVVSEALRNDDTFELPHGFADRVVAVIRQKAIQREARRDRWWLVAGVASIIIALVVVFTKVEFKPSVGVFTFIQGYWGLIIFGVLFVITLHIIDKRLLKKQESG